MHTGKITHCKCHTTLTTTLTAMLRRCRPHRQRAQWGHTIIQTLRFKAHFISLIMNKLTCKNSYLPLIALSISLFSGHCFSGSKTLAVAFFDYSNGLGSSSFTSLRSSGYEDPCWDTNFGEITGIGTAYINNIPPSLTPEALTAAIKNKPNARKNFSESLSQANLNGAYAFVMKGKTAYVYGISNQTDKISRSQPIPIKDTKILSAKVMSKALCQASVVMD
jgi:hypothetical protein